MKTIREFTQVGEFFSLLSKGQVSVLVPGYIYDFEAKSYGCSVYCDIERIRMSNQSHEIIGKDMPVKTIFAIFDQLTGNPNFEVVFATRG